MPAPRDCQIGGYANFFEENAHLDEWSISMNESSTGKGDAAPTGMVVREDLDAARYAEAAQVLPRALAACCAVAWAGAPQLSIWQATDSCFLTAHLPFPTSPPACAKRCGPQGWRESGAVVVGGCCGIDPSIIAEVCAWESCRFSLFPP